MLKSRFHNINILLFVIFIYLYLENMPTSVLNEHPLIYSGKNVSKAIYLQIK